MSALTGSSGKLKRFDTLTSKQKKTLNKSLDKIDFDAFNLGKSKLYKQGSELLRDLMKPGALDSLYGQLEAPAMRQFQEEIVPGIAERFSGMGAGAQSSSAFANTMGQAGAGLAERLAALRGQLTQAGVQQQLQASQIGLGYAQAPGQMSLNLAQLGLGTPAFGYQNIAAQPGIMQGAMSGLGKGVGAGMGALAGGFFGGPVGALAGAGIGSGIGSIFG